MKDWLRSRPENILILLIFAGFLLRLWGIKQDLPHNYYGDESYLIYNALKFGSGDLNPHWFIWPTLFQYFLFFLFGIFYFLGLLIGWFKNTADFLYFYIKDPTAFFLIGRITSTVCGTASFFLVYFIGKKSYNKEVGLIAASIFTFLPLSVEYSHYATVDTPMVFMILLSLGFIINVFLYARMRNYLLSGFFIGMAIGTKYPAAFLIFALLLAHLFHNYKSGLMKVIFDRRIFLSFLFIFLGFLLACPFAVLDFPKFFSDVKGQILCAKIGWFGWEKANPYVYHLTHNLNLALGLPLLIFSIISLIYVLIQRKRISLILLSFPIIYYLFIGLDKNTYPRFMLPVLAFLAIFSGVLLLEFKKTLDRRYRNSELFYCGFLIFLLFQPIYTSIKTDLNFDLSDTRTLAKKWIEKNISPGSKILLNIGGPPLIQSPQRIKLDAASKPQDQLRYGYHKKRDLFYEMKEKAASVAINYQLAYIPHPIGYLEGECGYEQMMLKAEQDLKGYKEKHDFVIISDVLLYKLIAYPKESIPERYLSLRDFYQDMLNNYKPIRLFLAQENISKGPTIRVYKLK